MGQIPKEQEKINENLQESRKDGHHHSSKGYSSSFDDNQETHDLLTVDAKLRAVKESVLEPSCFPGDMVYVHRNPKK